MEWSKLKNIILAILLTVNLFLLILVVYRQEQSTRYLDSARENAVGVLAQKGIAVDSESLPWDKEFEKLSMQRDGAKEASLVAAFLGTVREGGQGGIALYTGEQGSARFSRSGAVSADLRADAYPLGERTVKEHALATLEMIGVEGEVLSVEEHRGRTTVIVRQLWKEIPVFTCQMTLIYERAALVSIREGESCRLTGDPVAGGTAETISVVTALLRFLEGMSKLGDVCTSLTGMTPGYTFLPGLSDPITLDPVWYITTDTGAYYLDAVNGTLARAN